MRKTVLIVDDHDGFRDSARALLEAEGFEVIGTAADGAAARAAGERQRPQDEQLDEQEPGMVGFAVAERLAAVAQPPCVVLVSTRSAATYGQRLEAAAACGFLAKAELSGAALRALIA